jgi:hypothetical protein
MVLMSVYWMETAIAMMPADKSQVTFLFDRTGDNRNFILLQIQFQNFMMIQS